ncbi:MAG: N-acetyl-gamma-glutamyl-phosphate reductase [Gammaproteobacteria bacterium]|nr:N-acetyl-gamma-glutamyl-phosphate reductase [Gammaproteobacteria bacterium]
MARIPVMVLGGSGYVAGELLRLLATHPRLEVAAVLSESRAGDRVSDVFPQLQTRYGDLRFGDRRSLLAQLPAGRLGLFSAAPHGASAALIAEFVQAAGAAATELTVVDVSADFRYENPEDYAAVYGQPHGAPTLLTQFTAALPEHLAVSERPHIGHPGCFATALLLATVPLLELGLTRGGLHASGVTGSTGSGRSPLATTHHPERHSNLFAYKPLAHRHAPEVTGICAQLTGKHAALHFVPHSGPFARGIHLTLQAQLETAKSGDELRGLLADFYASSQFVQVRDGTPRIKDVVGSNFAHLGIATDGDAVAVFVAIDNLVKGAAGGAIQWMNRQLDLPESSGLDAPAMAWA